MNTHNMAYNDEYIQHRKRFDYIFDEKYKCDDIETRSLLDGKFKLKTSYYSDPTHEVHEFNLSASKTEMFDSSGLVVAEFKNIDHHVDFFSVIQHSNGKDYLFFSIDLYGYSMMDLSNYKIYRYIPKESFGGQGETFIWTNILYCKKNNTLAVDGCYWACPSSIEFYDLSDPEEFPFNRIYTSYDMDGEINIDSDVIPLHWNDDGTIVIECYVGNSETKVEKTIDVKLRCKSILKGTDVLSVSE